MCLCVVRHACLFVRVICVRCLPRMFACSVCLPAVCVYLSREFAQYVGLLSHMFDGVCCLHVMCVTLSIMTVYCLFASVSSLRTCTVYVFLSCVCTSCGFVDTCVFTCHSLVSFWFASRVCLYLACVCVSCAFAY